MASVLTKADERLIQAECDRLPGDPAESAFRAALEQTPHDAATRLVYADWLGERGRAEDELVQRLLGTRAVLVRDLWSYSDTAGKAVWDVFVRADDPLDDLLGGGYSARWREEDVEPNPYIDIVLTHLDPPFVRHCYVSPAEAEADLLRAYKALLQKEGAG